MTTKTWPLFEICVEGFEPTTVAARNRGAALYSKFLDFSDAYDVDFRRWLSIAKVRRIPAPAASRDPYDYVRRYYGRDIRHGTRVTITGEGRDLEGRAGTVIHPGRDSTAHAHVVLDGDPHAIIVHPYSVVVA